MKTLSMQFNAKVLQVLESSGKPGHSIKTICKEKKSNDISKDTRTVLFVKNYLLKVKNFSQTWHALRFFWRKRFQLRSNNQWTELPMVVLKIMHTKFSNIVMILWVVSNEDHVMLLTFSYQVNAAGYIDVSKIIIKLWIDEICNSRSYLSVRLNTFS